MPFLRQDAQIGSTRDTIVGFDDTVAPSLANFQTNAANIATDLNNVRSMLSHLKDVQAGNWYDVLITPSALETGAQRGVDDLNDALHLVEKKRVLRCVYGLKSLSIATAGDQFDILGTGELPTQTTAAVGAVSTLGTVVAQATTFGTAGLDEVAGTTAINPKNLIQIVDAASRDPILDSGGDRIYGLLQTEDGVDGHTITDTTPTRVQISFVKLNVTGNDLELIAAGEMDGVTYDYCYNERVRLEDLNEGDFLGGANVDVPSGTTVSRQVAYDNQGVTPVDLVTNATLDLEGPGLTWAIRDDLEAVLFEIIEGSAGGTSQVNIGAAVDEFDVDAVVNDFANGVTMNSAGTRPIRVGVVDGVIDTTAGDLKLDAAALLAFEDSNKAGSTFATDLVLSDSSTEWDAAEVNFGEVSLLSMINQAYENQVRTRVDTTLTTNVAANTDVNGPGTPHNNTAADLPPYDSVPTSFVNDVEVYLNGELLQNDASSGGSNHVYPGGTPTEGDLQFNLQLRGTGSNVDRLTVIVNGQ